MHARGSSASADAGGSTWRSPVDCSSSAASATSWPASSTAAILTCVQALPLVWRRHHPVPVFAIVAAASALQAVLIDTPTVGQLAFPVAVYSVARWAPRWHGVAALLVGYAGAVVASVRWLDAFGSDAVNASSRDVLRRHHRRDRHHRLGARLRRPAAGEVRRCAGRARRDGRAHGRARGAAGRPGRACPDRPGDARRGRPRAVRDRGAGRRRALRGDQGPGGRGHDPGHDRHHRPGGADRDATAARTVAQSATPACGRSQGWATSRTSSPTRVRPGRGSRPSCPIRRPTSRTASAWRRTASSRRR